MGPPDYLKGSLGELLLNSFRNFPKDFVLQINGETGDSQTAGELLERSVQVASGLRKLKVDVEDVVVIASHFSVNNIAAIYGTILQGATPFPLEHNLKQREFEHMFKLSRPKLVLVTENRLSEALKALSAIKLDVPVFVLDGMGPGAKPFEDLLDKNVDVDGFVTTPVDRPDKRFAAVVPSSGTSGMPKGVAATHSAHIYQLSIWKEQIPVPKEPFLAITPPFWISGFGMLLLSVVCGFTRVYLADTKIENILHAIHTFKPEWAIFAPITMARMLNFPSLSKYDFSSMKKFLVGGSSVPHSTINLVRKTFPHISLEQGYGMTEVCGLLTIPFSNVDAYSAGKPFPEHNFKVVDEKSGEELGPMEIGEFVFKSSAIMTGYINNEEATRNAFDKNGYYRTGDIGYVDEKGCIYFTGRSKELFKVKNHQVSPAEIEDVIRGLSAVADVAVVGIPHETEQNHPRALVVKEPGATLTLSQIIDEVAGCDWELPRFGMSKFNDLSSLGELLANGFRNLPKDFSIQINGETGESQTAGEVWALSVQVAAGLRKLKVAVEDVVVIASHYSENSIAALYGSILQGAAPFPIEHNLKQHEFQHKFKISLPKVIFVTKDRLQDALNALSEIGHKADVFTLDEQVAGAKTFEEVLDTTVDIEAFGCPHIDKPNERIAMILPSSGTTGLPKGVAGTHSAYITQLSDAARIMPKAPYLQLTPPFWLSGLIFVIYSPLFGFQRIYLRNVTPTTILAAIDKYKTTWATLSPMILMKLMSHPDFEKYDLTSLESVTSAGSNLPSYVIDVMKNKLPHVKLFQVYASTELSGPITTLFDPSNVMSAGKFMPFVTPKIVDTCTRIELPSGKEGEVLLKSPSMMKCYLRNEEATRSTFDDEGFFLTGDIGYIDQNGYLHLTGRLKERFLVKGVQVTPSEIEDVIRSLPGIADVAVVGVPHKFDQNHPRALVVRDVGSTISEAKIIAAVADQLSEEKQLFGGVQFVTSLPRNINGKLLRLELPKFVIM